MIGSEAPGSPLHSSWSQKKKDASPFPAPTPGPHLRPLHWRHTPTPTARALWAASCFPLPVPPFLTLCHLGSPSLLLLSHALVSAMASGPHATPKVAVSKTGIRIRDLSCSLSPPLQTYVTLGTFPERVGRVCAGSVQTVTSDPSGLPLSPSCSPAPDFSTPRPGS